MKEKTAVRLELERKDGWACWAQLACLGFWALFIKGLYLSPEVVNLGCYKAQKAAFKLDSGSTVRNDL